MVFCDDALQKDVIKKTQERIRKLFNVSSHSSVKSFDAKKLFISSTRKNRSKDQVTKALKKDSAVCTSAESENSSKENSDNIDIFDERINYLHQKVGALREKANLMMEKIAKMPDLDGDVQELKSEIEIMKEMERINLELFNFNSILNKTQNDSNSTVSSTSQYSKGSHFYGRRQKGGIIYTSIESIDQGKDDKNTLVISCSSKCSSNPSKEFHQKKGSHGDLLINGSKEFPRPYISDCKPLKKRRSSSEKLDKKKTKSSKKKRSDAESKSSAESFDFGNCQCNSNKYNGCDIDNIIKENAFLRKKMMETQDELEEAKGDVFRYETLSKKIYRMFFRENVERQKEKPKLSARLTQIKKILESSFALPPFPETVEVYKSLCLLLLNNLEYAEKKMTDTPSVPKYADLLKTSAGPSRCNSETDAPNVILSSVLDINTGQKYVSSKDSKTEGINNKFIVLNGNSNLTFRNSKEILDELERIMTTTKQVQKSSTNNNISDNNTTNILGLKPSSITNFQKLYNKISETQNLKIYVQHLPKKDAYKNKEVSAYDKVYLIFVN